MRRMISDNQLNELKSKNLKIPHLYQHNIYIKTNKINIYLTVINSYQFNYNYILQFPIVDKHISCTGYYGGNPSGVITSFYVNSTKGKFYISIDAQKDREFFTNPDVIEFTDEVTDTHIQ